MHDGLLPFRLVNSETTRKAKINKDQNGNRSEKIEDTIISLPARRANTRRAQIMAVIVLAEVVVAVLELIDGEVWGMQMAVSNVDLTLSIVWSVASSDSII